MFSVYDSTSMIMGFQVAYRGDRLNRCEVNRVTREFATVRELTRNISTELLVAAGLPRTGLRQTLFKPLVWPPAHFFSRLAAEFDQRVAESGFTEAVRWALSRGVDGIRTFGTEHVPQSGPVVVASNHPGSYDGLVVASALARDDLRIVATNAPFLRAMYATAPHFIYTSRDAHERMSVVRESIRHLRDGGALLIFARGKVEPDPAVLPGAERDLQDWSPSLSMFLRQVPETKLVVSIVSGVLSPTCLDHPITRLRNEFRYKQVLAEIVQISQQILIGRTFGLTPAVRFAPPLTATELGGVRDTKATLAAIMARAQELLETVQAGSRAHTR